MRRGEERERGERELRERRERKEERKMTTFFCFVFKNEQLTVIKRRWKRILCGREPLGIISESVRVLA